MQTQEGSIGYQQVLEQPICLISLVITTLLNFIFLIFFLSPPFSPLCGRSLDILGFEHLH